MMVFQRHNLGSHDAHTPGARRSLTVSRDFFANMPGHSDLSQTLLVLPATITRK